MCADGVTVSIVLLAEINVGVMSVTVFCHICTFLCDTFECTLHLHGTLLITQTEYMVSSTESLATQSSVTNKPYFGPQFDLQCYDDGTSL